MELIIVVVLVGAFVVFVLPAIIGALATIGTLLMVGACILTVALALVSLLVGG